MLLNGSKTNAGAQGKMAEAKRIGIVEDSMTFLGSQSKPRIGFVIFCIEKIYSTIARAIELADEDHERRPNAYAIAKHFEEEFKIAFDDWLPSEMYRVGAVLTPERACILSRVDFNSAWDIVSSIYQSHIGVGGMNAPQPKRQRLSAGPTDSSVLLNLEEDVPEDAFVGESEDIVDEGAGEACEAGEY